MCKKVRDLVYSDRRIQVDEIAQPLGISHGSVSTILHDRLGMRKLTARVLLKEPNMFVHVIVVNRNEHQFIVL